MQSPAALPGRPTGRSRPPITQREIVFAIFIVLFAGCSLAVPGFLTTDNLITLLRSVSILGIMSVAMALIVIARGIDLSLVSSMVVPPGLLLQMINDGSTPLTAFGAALALTLAFGALNGWLAAFAEVPALFGTLATGLLLAGLGQAVFFPLDIVPWPAQIAGFTWLGRAKPMGMPITVVFFALTCAAGAALLTRTGFGTIVYAIGDNPLTARLSGLPVRRTVVKNYMLAALVAAFAGMLLGASIGTVNTRMFNSTLIYDVVLVVVLGGVGLAGGRGGMSNVLVGTALIGTLLNAMTILDFSYAIQNVIRGVILLIAILVDTTLNPRNEETAQQSDI